MRIAGLIARYLLGLWYLVHGLNWFVRMFPQSHGLDSRWFVEALMASGLFSVVKVVQFVGGGCLVFNRFTPAGVAMLMPISVVVAYNDIVLEHSPVAWLVGFVMIGLNTLLLFAYSEYFVPLLTYRSRMRGLAGLKDWRAAWHERS